MTLNTSNWASLRPKMSTIKVTGNESVKFVFFCAHLCEIWMKTTVNQSINQSYFNVALATNSWYKDHSILDT